MQSSHALMGIALHIDATAVYAVTWVGKWANALCRAKGKHYAEAEPDQDQQVQCRVWTAGHIPGVARIRVGSKWRINTLLSLHSPEKPTHAGILGIAAQAHASNGSALHSGPLATWEWH